MTEQLTGNGRSPLSNQPGLTRKGIRSGEKEAPERDRAPDPGLEETRPALRRAVEEALYRNRFQVDEESHLTVISQETCRACPEKWCNYICPAAVYEFDAALGENLVYYEGCLECGTCRIACPYRNIDWRFPRGGFGVQYRYG